MLKKVIVVIVSVFLILLLAACDAGQGGPAGTVVTSPSTVTTYPPGMVEAAGVVSEVKEGLVLIDLKNNGGKFMLRFSENTKWDAGVNKEVKTGNMIRCLVKLEPTFTTPSQGEVIRVLQNDPSK